MHGTTLKTLLTVISVMCPPPPAPIQNGMSMKKKSKVYPNMPSAIRPVLHADTLPVPELPGQFCYVF